MHEVKRKAKGDKPNKAAISGDFICTRISVSKVSWGNI